MANDSITPIMCPLTYDGKLRTGNPQTQAVNGAQCEDPLGRIWRDVDPETPLGVRVFKFVTLASDAVLAQNATTVPAGTVVYYDNDNCTSVTNDVSDSSANRVAGVIHYARTPGNNGWIQTDGYRATVLANNDTFAENKLVTADPTVDGVCAAVTIGTAPAYPPLGTALGASSGTTKVVETILHAGKYGPGI